MYQGQNPYDNQRKQIESRLNTVRATLDRNNVNFAKQNISQKLDEFGKNFNRLSQQIKSVPDGNDDNLLREIQYALREVQSLSQKIMMMNSDLGKTERDIQNNKRAREEEKKLSLELQRIDKQSKDWVNNQTKKIKDNLSGVEKRGGGIFGR